MLIMPGGSTSQALKLLCQCELMAHTQASGMRICATTTNALPPVCARPRAAMLLGSLSWPPMCNRVLVAYQQRMHTFGK